MVTTIQKKCDICGKDYQKEDHLKGTFVSGTGLISNKLKDLSKSAQGFNLDLCPMHYLEFLGKVREWVFKETTLDRYMTPEISVV